MWTCYRDTGELGAASNEVQNYVFSGSIKTWRDKKLSVFITVTLENSNEEVSKTNHFGSVSDSLGRLAATLSLY